MHFFLVDFGDFGLWVTILGMVGDLTILMIVADHPWYFTWSYICELSRVAIVFFLLVDIGCDHEKSSLVYDI